MSQEFSEGEGRKMAKGLNQYEVAARVNCSPETVSKDVAWLRNYYKQRMHH